MALSDAPGSTARLAYRRWQPEDAPWVRDTYARPEVFRFLGSNPQPLHDVDEARARIVVWNDRTSEPFGIWAITLADSPIGTVLLVPLPRSDGTTTDAVEVGWHLHPDAWGHGYATEAARTVIDRASAAGIELVHAVTYPDNLASRAVCRRLCMTERGLTDEWYGVTLMDHTLSTG